MPQFLNGAYRHIRDGKLSKMASALSVDESLVHLRPVYEKLSKQLIAMHKAEHDLSSINNYAYSTIRQGLPTPLLLESPSTQSAPQPSDLVSTGNFLISPAAVHPSASIQELARFVTVSSRLDNHPWKLADHEHQRRTLSVQG